jgi:hypothetical protein
VGTFQNAGDVFTWSPLNVTSGNYVQTAGTTALSVFPFASDPSAERGRLVVENGSADFRGGMLTGLGIVDGDVHMGGTLAIDRTSTSDPHLEVNGRYTQSDSGVLKIYINDTHRFAELYGDLQVNGDALLGGTVDFVFCTTCPPRTGDEFVFVNYANRLGDSRFSTIEFENWTPPEWAIDYGPSDVTLRITRGVIASPEPGTALLFCGGLTAIAFLGMKRRSSRKGGRGESDGAGTMRRS